MNEPAPDKRTILEIIGIIVAIIFGIFGIIVPIVVALSEPKQIEVFLQTWTVKLFIICVCIITFCIGYLVARGRSKQKVKVNDEQMKNIQEELEQITRERDQKADEINKLKAKPIPYFDRWGSIKGIKYGHIDYSPMLYHDNQGKPVGIGITILNKIFNTDFVHASQRMHWDQIEEHLYEKDPVEPNKYLIDIIATPIFETNERSQNVGFTSPIFYSEIGIYCSKGCKFLGHQKPMDFDNAIATLKGFQDKLKFCAIEGELSDRMMNKYFGELVKDKKYKPYKAINVGLPELLGLVYKGEKDVAFMETFQADLMTRYSDRLINLLNPNELLYPVGFALRKEDYVLRRFINLKLLELDSFPEDGNNIMELIKNELENIHNFFIDCKTDEEKMQRVRKYFIREYDGGGTPGANILHLGSSNLNG
jgi:hypothetical protein